MGHTLVGKSVPLQLEGLGFKPLGVQSADLQAGPGIPWVNFCFLFFFCFCLL